MLTAPTTRTTISKALTFRLPLDPFPAPRPRFRVITVPGRRPIASAYSPKPYADWQKDAAAALNKVMAERFEGPVSVTLRFHAARPKTTKLPHPRPDIDNYVKAMLDAITKDGRFWTDDTQVAVLMTVKAWAEPGEPGSIGITIEDYE